MKTCVASLKSISPISFSKMHEEERLKDETYDLYEGRIFREKAHINGDGKTVIIPPMMLKKALDAAAANLKMKKRGMTTWTKHIVSGTLISDPIVLNCTKDKLEAEWIWANADGKKNSGTRVKRCFPVVKEWKGEATIAILDDQITDAVLEEHLNCAGKFVGLGRFRPANGGFYGRFVVEKVRWE